jgi:ribosome-associated protein
VATNKDNVIGEEDVKRWVVTAARAADEKKGTDIVVLDVSHLLGITDAFVIVSASSDRQARTVAEEVERQVKLNDGPSPRRIEGMSSADWVLLDYGDFVVHVFQQETRDFYELERLWADAPVIEWQPAYAN